MGDSPDSQRRGVSWMKRFKHVPSFARPWRWEYVMNAMLLLIAVSIIGQTYYLHAADKAGLRKTATVGAHADAENATTSRCLRDSVVDLTDVLQARLTPTEVEREATRALILGVLNGPSPDEGLALVVAYKRALHLADKMRDENPVPDYPDGLCESPTAPPGP